MPWAAVFNARYCRAGQPDPLAPPCYNTSAGNRLRCSPVQAQKAFLTNQSQF
jgi:hypothetical protein